MDAQSIIEHYGLKPHPEGGFYCRTYAATFPVTYCQKTRPVSTAILFLLKAGQYSRLHRLPQDEMWHFYLGDPLRLVVLTAEGSREVILGHDIQANQYLQYSVQGGAWFGAKPATGSAYSFVGCTVSPGFMMEDLELGEQDSLLAKYPEAAALIKEFSPPSTKLIS